MVSGTSRLRLSARRPGRLPAALVLAGLLALTACSGDDDGDPAAGEPGTSASDDLTVIAPGKPGEAARTLSPDEIEIDDPWNHADVAFVQMMIPHHAQALEMSDLAVTRAEDPRVVRLADRIQAAQRPEILTMAAWLEERGVDVPRAGEDPASYDHGEHGHNSMHGMLTPAQMTELEKASGAEFDRLFLAGMIRHHEGAVAMAQDVARDGAHVRVSELAADVIVGQQDEIEIMERMLGRG